MLKVLRTCALAGLGVLILASLTGFRHRKVDLCFSNGDRVSIKPAPFWRSVRGSDCAIFYRPRAGEAGTVVLWQDLVHGVIAVVPASRTNVLLCLYDFDTDLRLIKIDATMRFVSLPAKTATYSGCIGAVVCSSPWNIEEAKIGDWQETIEYLKKSPPRHSFGLFGVGGQRKHVLQRVEEQIKMMVDNGATEWPVMRTRP